MVTEDASSSNRSQTVRRPWFQSFAHWRNLTIAIIVVSPLLIRAWCLTKIPPAATPFDIEEFCQIEIEPGQNAFDDFREATKLKEAVEAGYRARDYKFQWADYDAVLANDWSVATEPLKQWLIDHREAIKVWHRGTTRADSLYVSPRDINFDTLLPAVQALRDFARLAQCEAMRLEAEGQLLEAAELYLAILRSSDLARRHGCIIQSLVGIAMYAVGTERLVRWSEDSRLTAEDLRFVLTHVHAVNQHFEPSSAVMKVEYLSTIHSVSQRGWSKGTGLTEKYAKFEPYASTGMEAFFWILGEPEFARRVVTHVLANQLPEIDKPLAERSPMANTSSVGLFEQADNSGAQQLSPEVIERAVQRSIVARQVMTSFKQHDTAVGRYRARRIGLELALASQIYFREHGEFPAEPSALVPDYIASWPADPMQSTPDGLMLYDYESAKSARIRSLGAWGFDVTLQVRVPKPIQTSVTLPDGSPGQVDP